MRKNVAEVLMQVKRVVPRLTPAESGEKASHMFQRREQGLKEELG